MNNIYSVKLYQNLGISSTLEEEVKLLVNLILLENKYQFTKNQFLKSTKLLKKYGVIKKTKSDLITIQNSEILSYILLDTLIGKHDFLPSNDFSENFKFIDYIETVYEKVNLNLGGFEEYFIKFFLIYTNEQFQSDFKNFIHNDSDILKENKFRFADAFVKTLPFLELPNSTLTIHLNTLLGLLNGDGTYYIFLNDLKKYFLSVPEKSLTIFEDLIEQSNYNSDILSTLIASLYSNYGKFFFNKYLQSFLKNGSHTVAIIIGFSNVELKAQDNLTFFISIYDQFFQICDERHKLYFIHNLITVIDNNTENEIVEKCFLEISNIIKSTNDYYIIDKVLWRIATSKNNTNKVLLKNTNLMYLCISSLTFTEGHLSNLDTLICSQNVSNDTFSTIIEQIAIKFPLKCLANKFQQSLRCFLVNQKKEFEQTIIQLLIHNIGFVRFLANDILGILSNKGYKFENDILKLNSLSQYKLWVSITTTHKEPKYILPTLLPLINSKNLFVRESFIAKIENYSENYGWSVIDLLKQELNLNNDYDKLVYERTYIHRKDFSETKIRIKQDVKELDPNYVQNRYLSNFRKNFHRNMGNTIRENVEKNSIISQLATTVILAKGGGWQIDKNREISKLSNIEQSVSLPRDFFIEPEIYNLEFTKSINENWQKIFDKWEAIISSFENT